jgi:hypothetical protein
MWFLTFRRYSLGRRSQRLLVDHPAQVRGEDVRVLVLAGWARAPVKTVGIANERRATITIRRAFRFGRSTVAAHRSASARTSALDFGSGPTPHRNCIASSHRRRVTGR